MRMPILRLTHCIPALLALTVLMPRYSMSGEVVEPAKDDKSELPKKLVRQLRPEAIAPENPLLYISTPDVKKARSSFERTAFKALLNEDEVSSPVTTAFSKLRDVYVKGDGTRLEAEMKLRGEEVDLLMKASPLFESNLALSIEGDADALVAMTGGKLPRFLLIAALPPGDAGGDRQQQLEDILDAFRARLTIDAKYRDFDSSRADYSVHGLENPELGIYHSWTFIENLFVFGQGKGMVDDAIDRFSTKKGAGSLSQSPEFLAAYKQVGRDDKGEAMLYLQLDPRPLLGKERLENPVVRRMLGNPAPNGKLQVSFGLQVGEGLNAPIREKLLIRGPTAASGMKAGEGCRAYSSRFVANDSLFYWAALGNLPEFFESNKELLGTFFDGGSATLEEKLAAAMAGKDPVEMKKKLELFKGEFSVFIDYIPKAVKVGSWDDLLANFQFVVCLELDRENVSYEPALKELMTKIETATGVPYVTTNTSANTATGAIIRYQRGSAQGEDTTSARLGLRNNLKTNDSKTTPFFACWTKVDMETEPGPVLRHFLLLSDDLPSLRKAMSQRNSPRTSLAEDVRFKDVMKTFRETRTELTYFDLLKATSVYSSLIPVATKAELIDRDTVGQFPSMSALKPHLFPMAQARSVLPAGEGLLTEYSSPTGNMTMAGLIASIAWPAITTQRQRVISDEVDSKFKQIMLGLQLYAADFDRFPPQLSDLVPNYIDQKWKVIFESPFARGALQTPADIDNPDLTNIVYVPNRNLLDLGSDIILYEKQPTRLQRDETTKLLHHVLSVDGRIHPMPKVALERLLQGKYMPVMMGNNKSPSPPKSGKENTTPRR